MTDSSPPREGDWHLRAWAKRLGKRQVDLINELGWDRNAAHRIWHGVQPYRRDHVNQISAWLGIAPHELLMHPDDAIALRRLRETARMIVLGDGAEDVES